MLAAPQHWEELWEADGSAMELRFRIDGKAYYSESIASTDCNLTHYLYDSYGIGNACSGKLTVTLYDPDPIASGVRTCYLACRLVSEDGSTATEWVPQGTWYLDSAEFDDDAGTVKLTLADGIALCETQLYPSGQQGSKAASELVRQVCSRTGLGYPTDLSPLAGITCPPVKNITCREALQSIAAVAGGNWTVAADGKLRFVPLADAAHASSVMQVTASSLRRASAAKTVTGVSLSNGSDTYERGSDGLMLASECLYAGGDAANAAYYATRGRSYQGFEATGAYLSPLVELGDAVEIDGQKIVVDSVSVLYEQGLWGTVAAPMRDEIEQRIKYRSAQERKVNRLALDTADNAAAIDAMATSEYVSQLLERINAQANDTGGYTYITEGQGIRTYDVAVTDPLVGAEASSVVEVKGGTVRIANSRWDSGEHRGEWKWLTVFESGHVAAELVTAVNVVAGFIGSPSGNFWNLDTGELRMESNVTVGGQTVQQIADTAASDAADELNIDLMQDQIFDRLFPVNPTTGKRQEGFVIKNGKLFINADYLKTGTIKGTKGGSSWNLRTGEFVTDNGTLSNCDVKGTLSSGSQSGVHAVFNGGNIQFFNGRTKTMWLKASAKFKDGKYGGFINYKNYLILAGPKIAVSKKTDTSGQFAFTGTVQLHSLRYASKGKYYSNGHVTLKFVNGLFMGVVKHKAGCCTVSKEK